MKYIDNNNKRKEKSLEARLAWSVVTIVILSLCLCVTSLAVVYAILSVSNNIFTTAKFDIELYNADDVLEGTVISEGDVRIEPGATFKKEFSIVSKCSVDAYFRVYFDKVSGALADSVEMKITDDADNVIYDWSVISDMLKKDAVAADRIIEPLERVKLYIWVRMPETIGNEAMTEELCFDICVDAVQHRNNENAEFEIETN